MSKPEKFTAFRLAYDRGDLPIRIDHSSKGPQLRWTKDVSSVDCERLLPLFCDGLREKKFPYDFLAEEACTRLIGCRSESIIDLVPYLVQPLREALRSKDPRVVLRTLTVLQKVATCVPNGGSALVPYYRQLLPALGYYMNKNKNLGDNIEYDQRRNQNLADVVEETLQIFEKTGGPNAFVNIRYVIPLYESCTGSR